MGAASSCCAIVRTMCRTCQIPGRQLLGKGAGCGDDVRCCARLHGGVPLGLPRPANDHSTHAPHPVLRSCTHPMCAAQVPLMTEPQVLYARGQFLNGSLDAALRKAQDILRRNPEHFGVHLLICRCAARPQGGLGLTRTLRRLWQRRGRWQAGTEGGAQAHSHPSGGRERGMRGCCLGSWPCAGRPPNG